MTLHIDVVRLQEPMLEFGGVPPRSDPKVGLRESGPFSLRFDGGQPGEVRLGVVGPQAMVEATHRWFARCQGRILSPMSNRERFPDFPGFQEVFRTPLVLADRMDVVLPDLELQRALLQPKDLRFREVVEMYAQAVGTLADRQMGPNVVVCALPEDVLEKCFTLEAPKAAPRTKTGLGGSLQLSLPLDGDDEDDEERFLYRTFRRALKARVMLLRKRLPTQIAHNKLLVDGPGKDDPATRAWSVCVALFYKAGGVPWRLAHVPPQVLFVGLSFHRYRTTKQDAVFASTAQAYSTEIEGFVLRLNERIPRRTDRQPSLTGEQAERLGRDILEQYRLQAERSPVRIVLHKTTRFRPEEEEGFNAAFRDVAVVEYVSVNSDEPRLQLYGQGQYPPARGTLCSINDDAWFLYTTGYYADWGTYPGPHVPRPLEITLRAGVENPRRACEEILGLTKMNWNAAHIGGSQPITLWMAREVGPIMAEVPDHEEPELSYRYYM